MRRLGLLAAAGLVAGCTNQLAVRQTQLAALVGRPEIDLIQAMGVPTRVYDTGGMKFLSYEDRRVEIVPGWAYDYGPGPFWYGGGFPPAAVNLACDTTFTVEKGIVRAFNLRGNACG